MNHARMLPLAENSIRQMFAAGMPAPDQIANIVTDERIFTGLSEDEKLRLCVEAIGRQATCGTVRAFDAAPGQDRTIVDRAIQILQAAGIIEHEPDDAARQLLEEFIGSGSHAEASDDSTSFSGGFKSGLAEGVAGGSGSSGVESKASQAASGVTQAVKTGGQLASGIVKTATSLMTDAAPMSDLEALERDAANSCGWNPPAPRMRARDAEESPEEESWRRWQAAYDSVRTGGAR